MNADECVFMPEVRFDGLHWGRLRVHILLFFFSVLFYISFNLQV